MPDEVGLHFLQGNSDFSAAGLGNKPVPKILQAGSVLFQVDENRDLPAFAVGDELNSSHRSIFPQESPSPEQFRVPVKLHRDVTAHLKVVIEKEAVAE